MVRIFGIFLEGFFIPGELLYLKAVSDSCQTLPDPGKLAHDLKAFIFRFFENIPRGSINTPDFGTQRLFRQNADRNGEKQSIFPAQVRVFFLVRLS